MILPRAEVVSLAEAEHGAGSLASNAREILDFSANTNPYGPPPGVANAVSNVPLDRYPDRESTLFRQALSARLGVSLECLIAGNGSSELLLLVALAYFRPGDVVMVVGPTYAEYARVATVMGAKLAYCDATVDTQFAIPIQQIEQSLSTLQPRAIFLCNPNNPTGQVVPALRCQEWIDAFPQTLFIVDEAYIEFSPSAASLAGVQRENLVVVRSLTKAYGLAGLRLGYAVSHVEVIRVLCQVRSPWNVSAVAQAAGVAALADMAYVERAITAVRAEKQSLIDRLNSLGITVFPSETHFFLLRVANASECSKLLMDSAILLRDCTSFGLPQFLRISAQSASANGVLCETLGRLTKLMVL